MLKKVLDIFSILVGVYWTVSGLILFVQPLWIDLSWTEQTVRTGAGVGLIAAVFLMTHLVVDHS